MVIVIRYTTANGMGTCKYCKQPIERKGKQLEISGHRDSSRYHKRCILELMEVEEQEYDDRKGITKRE